MKNAKLIILTTFLLSLFLFISAVSADTVYTVQRGDTLYSISRRFGVSVQEIAAANHLVNPDLIYAGQTLVIPDASPPSGGGNESPTQPLPAPQPPISGGGIYVVQSGDTLLRIAARYGVTVQALVQANNLSNPNLIYAGQSLIIPGLPGPGVPGATPQPTPPPQAPPPPNPPPPTGVNLFQNPSFEHGYYLLNGAPEVEVPHGWGMETDDGIPAPGTGITFFRPESRLVPRWGLPASEQPLYVWDGDWTIKVFKAHAPVSFRLFSDVHLEPGTYRFVAQYYPDLIIGYDSNGKIWDSRPLAGEVAFIGPSGGGWTAVTPGAKNTLVHEFTITNPGVVRLGAGFRTRNAIPNNGYFIDAWTLHRLS